MKHSKKNTKTNSYLSKILSKEEGFFRNRFLSKTFPFLLCLGCALISFFEVSAQENFSGCDKPEERKDLPFKIDRVKQMCKKDLDNKKEGWYPTGLPLINSDPNEGIGYGVRAYAYNNGKKSDPFFEYTPYRLRFFAQYFNTTKNAQYHQLSLDMPYVANTQWRLRADALLTITPTTLYFGVGESTLKPLTYQERNQPGAPQVTNAQYGSQESTFMYQRPGGPGDPVELGGRTYSGIPAGPAFNVTDRMYNRYTIQTPQLNFSTERSFFHGTVRLVAGFRLSNNIVQANDGKFVKSIDPIFDGTPLSNSGEVPNAKTRLTEDAESGKILGYHGGFVNTAKVGLVYDTRDFEPDPNSGVFLEATYEKATKTIGSNFDFQKYFGHAKFFYSPFPKTFEKLVLASRFGFGISDGDVPFFEYRNLWGTESTVSGLGGLRTLRGYKQDRFVGRAMGFGTVEVRWKFYDFSVGGEYFALNLVPFWDFGRVWNDEHKAGLLDYKYSHGLGLRIAWNQATIIMIDYAVSREDKQLFVNFSHVF
ncbi:Omp85 family outer membrane protein [Leptospira sanjuanensis]|uniref:Omp85 family outer membrane protein n=1 Tax=Leptospira sanjuanensis TaxID=2879643 RepID=UPI0038731739